MMERYSLITTGMKREFILLQGTGCRWKKCTFCDYYEDISENPFEINKQVLGNVTGIYGVLDIINSGSCQEYDEETIRLIQKTTAEKNISSLWFESHWMYRNTLESFRKLFLSADVHFRCGAETFNPKLRTSWNKGIAEDVTPEDIRKYFDGVCLLVGIKGQTREDIMKDVEIAERLFDYYSVNLFCPNSTATERDDELAEIFIREIAPIIRRSPKAEVLIENTDLGVG